MRSGLTIEVLSHRRNQYTVIVRSGHKFANGARNFSTTEIARQHAGFFRK
jgi:hypothetical protein